MFFNGFVNIYNVLVARMVEGYMIVEAIDCNPVYSF